MCPARHITPAVICAAMLAAVLGCSPTEKDDQPVGGFYFPTSITVHPGAPYQRYAYVVSSNFDLGYKTGTVKVIDLEELETEIAQDAAGTGCNGKTCAATHFAGAIVEGSTVKIGNFGGTSTVDPAAARLYVALRQNGRVAMMDVGEGGRTLDCRGGTADTPAAQPGAFIGDCHKGRLYKTGSDDPFTLAWGPNPSAPTEGCVYAAHLKEGVVTCLATGAPAGDDPATAFFADFSQGYSPSGINDIIFAPDGRMFAANRYLLNGFNLLGAVDPVAMGASPENIWWFDIAYIAGGAEQKSLALTRDGTGLYLLTHGPDALIRMDVGADAAGAPAINAVDYVAAGVWPERLFMFESDVPARRLLYVPCTDNDYIHVYDGATLEEITMIRDGLDGPYWMAFYDAGYGPRALVANFENSTVAVVAIDPAAMTHQTLAVIGPPRVKASGEY